MPVAAGGWKAPQTKQVQRNVVWVEPLSSRGRGCERIASSRIHTHPPRGAIRRSSGSTLYLYVSLSQASGLAAGAASGSAAAAAPTVPKSSAPASPIAVPSGADVAVPLGPKPSAEPAPTVPKSAWAAALASAAAAAHGLAAGAASGSAAAAAPTVPKSSAPASPIAVPSGADVAVPSGASGSDDLPMPDDPQKKSRGGPCRPSKRKWRSLHGVPEPKGAVAVKPAGPAWRGGSAPVGGLPLVLRSAVRVAISRIVMHGGLSSHSVYRGRIVTRASPLGIDDDSDILGDNTTKIINWATHKPPRKGCLDAFVTQARPSE